MFVWYWCKREINALYILFVRLNSEWILLGTSETFKPPRGESCSQRSFNQWWGGQTNDWAAKKASRGQIH
jgi:hypothetical protein